MTSPSPALTPRGALASIGTMNARPKILIADDDLELLVMLSRHLHEGGAEVLEARDGDAALACVRAARPHLVLLDVMMPGMSGWEVARRIRGDIALRDTGIVMLTGIGASLNALTAPLFDADARLDKPFGFESLDAHVAQVLARRHPGLHP